MPHTMRCAFTPYGRSLYRHRDDLFCSPHDLEDFEKELNQIRAEFPHKSLSLSGVYPDPYSGSEDERSSFFWKRAFCTANQRGAVVLPNGKVTICEELHFHEAFIIGDITEHTLMEVWNSPRALELAHPDQSAVPDGPCRDCPDFSRCHEGLGRCFRDTLKAYGYEKPYWPDPRCPRAPVGNRLS
jgi:radical SAM protein with 4Fe4S-binding SPASM domain